VINSPLNKMLSEQRRTPPNKGTRARAPFNAIAKEDEQERCSCCTKPHKLADCLAFSKMDRSDRIALMRHNRLCDNCFGKGHVSRRCKRASACKAQNCKYKHYTLLHFQPCDSTALISDEKTSFDTKPVSSSNNKENNSPSENGNASGACLTAQATQAVFMWIIPVKVQANGKGTVVNAFFDSGSGVTLCTQRLDHELNLKGCDSKITLSTVNGTLKSRSSKFVELEVLFLDGATAIDLPEAYSVDKLPVNSNHVNYNDLQRYLHLRDLVLPLKNDREVSLIIGANVPEAFCVEQVRKGKAKQQLP